MLRRQLSRALETGIAYEREESTPGLLCIAAPILGNNGQTATAALSVTGPTGRFKPETHANTVRATAAALTSTLTHRHH
ncbi:IclR family transcriptional regulator C-terminal domain-containing protein [Streptomyces sp. KHY 26]